MKCCVSTDVWTWTNLLTFEPDPDYSPDAGTGLLSLISYAVQRVILLRRKNPTYMYWAPVAAARRGFKMVLFTASLGNTTYGRQAFAVAGPTMFNTLPDDLRDLAVSTSTFRQSLNFPLFSAYQHI